MSRIMADNSHVKAILHNSLNFIDYFRISETNFCIIVAESELSLMVDLGVEEFANFP